MAGMKITLDAAMRTRDISQPTPAEEAAAERADAALPSHPTASPHPRPPAPTPAPPTPAPTTPTPAARAGEAISPDDAGPNIPQPARPREPPRAARRRMRHRARESGGGR